MEVCSCASSAAPAQVAVPPIITIDVPDDIMHTIHAHMRTIGAIERHDPPRPGFRHAFDTAPLNLSWWNSVGWTFFPSHAAARTFKQRLLRALWRPIFGDQEPRIAGVEYWHDMLSSGKPLHAHFDKDEALQDHSGDFSTPELGAVFYPFTRGMRGGAGRLRIFADQQTSTPDRMRAVASVRVHAGRMVLFDAGGRQHEVTSINAGGQRVHFGMNLWGARPWGVCKRGGMCRHEARVEGRCQCWDGFETGTPEVDFDP
jgi:hypothetical protein